MTIFLYLYNFYCSTDTFDNLNINKEDNLKESVELVNKAEEKYFDINKVNKTINISINYIIFTFYENKIINLSN